MITVLMGAPGAGKSTWLARNISGDEHIASTEPLRADRSLDSNIFMNQLRRRAEVAAHDGLDVIADGTHIDRRHRAFWLQLAGEANAETRLIIFNTSLPLLYKAQDHRTAPVAKSIVSKYHLDFKKALRTVHLEPWGSIETIVRGN
jgi:predicted kinase